MRAPSFTLATCFLGSFFSSTNMLTKGKRLEYNKVAVCFANKDVYQWKELRDKTRKSGGEHADISFVDIPINNQNEITYKRAIMKRARRKFYVKHSYDELCQIIQNEGQILSCINNEHLISMIGWGIVDDKNDIFLLLEYCPNGTLADVIYHATENNEPVPIRKVLTYMKSVAIGMQYLHERKPAIIHRDLKPANIFLGENDIVKIADFSSALLCKSEDNNSFKMKGSKSKLCYTAPECMIQPYNCNEKMDVYSFAIILWQLLFNQVPFESVVDNKTFVDIIIEKNIRPSIPRDTDIDIVQLLHECWKSDYEERLDFQSISNYLDIILQKENIIVPNPLISPRSKRSNLIRAYSSSLHLSTSFTTKKSTDKLPALPNNIVKVSSFSSQIHPHNNINSEKSSMWVSPSVKLHYSLDELEARQKYRRDSLKKENENDHEENTFQALFCTNACNIL